MRVGRADRIRLGSTSPLNGCGDDDEKEVHVMLKWNPQLHDGKPSRTLLTPFENPSRAAAEQARSQPTTIDGSGDHIRA